VKLGASRLIHPKGIQWLGWIHDVNSEQIFFLLPIRNTNEKINSYHLPLLKTKAEPSALLHQKHSRPRTAARPAGRFGKSTH